MSDSQSEIEHLRAQQRERREQARDNYNYEREAISQRTWEKMGARDEDRDRCR
ncbi:MAG TPA: hypothetical protein V6C89_21925 [Drouetiella sp.]